MATTIKLKNGTGAPSAGDLVVAEPALDLTNKRLYTEDSGGTVIEVGTNPGTDVTFADNRKAIFGAGSDLQIYHDGSNSYIVENGTGGLYIKGANTFQLQDTSDKKYFQGVSGAWAKLYYNDAEKLATTSTGIDVTGTASADQLNSNNGKLFLDDNGSHNGVINAPASLYVNFDSDNNSASEKIVFGYDRDGTSGGTSVMEINSTGIDVTGTATADGLTVDGTGTFGALSSKIKVGLNGDSISSDADFYIQTSTADPLILRTNFTQRQRIDSNGDISFYEDTGTTAKLFWDASAESLGIGTSSPSKKLSIKSDGGGSQLGIDIHNEGTATGDDAVISFETQGSKEFTMGLDRSATSFVIADSSTLGSNQRLVIDASGNVGIGTTSPQAYLHVYGTSAETLRLQGNDEFTYLSFRGTVGTEQRLGYLGFANDTGTAADLNLNNSQAGAISFSANGSEAMRIDSSGNLLVGKTSASKDTVGAEMKPDGRVNMTGDGIAPALINRKTSDGDIAIFQKDGSTVGSIGVDSGDNLYIGGSAASHGGLYFGTNTAAPLSAGTLTDDVMDLGTATYRFDDIYATNGTINTSDGNEKQDIEALSDAEQRVAVACKGLLRKFRWKSSVADKGDEARIHFGIIAQDLQAAFTAEGLDAGRYGMFINSTWTDEETNEERTRMGVRYSELLAFIIAAI
jgi:hypothetical protein